MYQSIRVSEYQLSNIFQVLHLVTVSGHDIEGWDYWLPQEVFSWRERRERRERLAASNKAVNDIAGRADTGLALATFLSCDCCSALTMEEVTIIILRIIPFRV